MQTAHQDQLKCFVLVFFSSSSAVLINGSNRFWELPLFCSVYLFVKQSVFTCTPTDDVTRLQVFEKWTCAWVYCCLTLQGTAILQAVYILRARLENIPKLRYGRVMLIPPHTDTQIDYWCVHVSAVAVRRILCRDVRVSGRPQPPPPSLNHFTGLL